MMDLTDKEKPIMAFDFKFQLREKVKFSDQEMEFVGRVTARTQSINVPDAYYIEVEENHPANGWYEETLLIKEK